MARSQEALLKRAAKRAVPVEVQRQKDKKRKIDDIKPDNWTCADCSFSNYAKRSSCKKCNKDRGFVAAPEAKKVKAESGNWICHKCSNKNFATRFDCNRCGEAKAAPTGSDIALTKEEVAITPTKSDPAPLKIKKVTPKPKPIIVAQQVVKHKKYDWGEQASAEKLEENKLLMEIFEGGKDSTAYQQLTEEEIERAKVLFARKARKEVKKARAEVTKSILKKKKKQKRVKSATTSSKNGGKVTVGSVSAPNSTTKD